MTKQDLALNYGGRVRAVRFTVGFADLQATSGSGAKAVTLADSDNPSLVFTLPNYSKVCGVSVKTTTAFAGGSLSALTVSLGISGSATRFTAAYDIFQAVADTTIQETAMWKLGQASAIAGGLILTFTPTGDSCSAATAGAMFVDVFFVEMTSTFTEPA